MTHFLFFFFQAEDGIRDHCVTGVQTCALPIFAMDEYPRAEQTFLDRLLEDWLSNDFDDDAQAGALPPVVRAWITARSEERRVGKECSDSGARGPGKTK